MTEITATIIEDALRHRLSAKDGRVNGFADAADDVLSIILANRGSPATGGGEPVASTALIRFNEFVQRKEDMDQMNYGLRAEEWPQIVAVVRKALTVKAEGSTGPVVEGENSSRVSLATQQGLADTRPRQGTDEAENQRREKMVEMRCLMHPDEGQDTKKGSAS